MVEVHIRQYKYPSGQPYWRVAWSVGGKEHTRKFRTEREANSHKARLLVELNIGGPSADELREFALCLHRLRLTPDGRSATVTQVFDHFVATYRTTTFPKLAAFVEDFVTRKAAVLREKSLIELRSYFGHLTKHFGHQVPGAVTSKQLEAYLAAHPARAHREKCLRPLFGWMAGRKVKNCTALEQPPLDRDPFLFITQVKYKKLGETEILHVPEVLRLIEAAKDDLATQAFIVWCLYTGMRPTEAARFWRRPDCQWTRVHENTVTIPQSVEKMGTRSREVAIQPNFRAWLTFFREKGVMPRYSRRKLTRAWKAAKLHVVRQDVFRHTYISHAVKIMPIDEVCFQCATSRRMIFDHYLRLVTVEEARKFFKIRPFLVPDPPAS